MSTPTASVIFTTYNSTEWLARTLDGFAAQTRHDFEVIVADDGSERETRDLLEQRRDSLPFDLQHVWQPDEGFRKCRILNKALLAARADYFIVTDGDCIARADFVDTHLRMRKPGHYLSGGYFKLPMSTSKAVTPELIADQTVFDKRWLREHGVKAPWHKLLKVTATDSQARWANRLTPATPTWNGNNASTWTRHALEVRGFDERMGYGGQDVEFGYRLVNAGVRPIMIRYSTVALHLDHARGYKNAEGIAYNRRIRAHTKRSGITRTEHGLRDEDIPELSGTTC